MKPSERIQQLVDDEHRLKPITDNFDACNVGLNAIVKYLDEQHEKRGE